MSSQQNGRAKRALELAFDAMEDRVLLAATIVPGTANPYRADQTNIANPKNLSGFVDGTDPPTINVRGESLLTFAVTGGTNKNPKDPIFPPDGGAALASSKYGARGDVSSWTLPIDSLAGIFEGATQGTAPVAYAYKTGSQPLNVSPLLGQVFPIGDGLTGHGTGSVQVFHVPAGATRLYLVNIDAYQWANDRGQFKVTVNFSKLTPPNPTTDYGAVVTLLLVESQNPYTPGYNASSTQEGMEAMVATVHNRLTKPKLFNAPGATTLSQIIGAKNQFAGFSTRSGGGVNITASLQTLITQIYQNANTSGSYQHQFRTYIRNAESIANSYVDPFANQGGSYGWRTDGSTDPGGVQVRITNGVLGGNKFYTLASGN